MSGIGYGLIENRTVTFGLLGGRCLQSISLSSDVGPAHAYLSRGLLCFLSRTPRNIQTGIWTIGSLQLTVPPLQYKVMIGERGYLGGAARVTVDEVDRQELSRCGTIHLVPEHSKAKAREL